MIQIAIVDDEINQIQLIQRIVENFFREKEIQISVNMFRSGELLLSESISYDLIFLDIQMGGMDGIETAQRLRVNNKKAVLFYVTSYQNYIQKSMTIHPFAFIVKPFLEEDVRRNLEDFLMYTNSVKEKKSQEIYQIHTMDDRRFQVNMGEILYFHYLDNRIVEIVMSKDIYRIKDGIMHIYSTLNPKYFIMPNQSFIVNLHRLREIDGKNKKLVMENGDLILIARRKYNEIIEALNCYIAEGV
ncbi:LytTR family DNA-binding domain-containing protein [Ruminococcus sp.]|uniref:LytR/AlgR family response regulator transcription factor n=1 Tax=Ruminococcus sp. TaxID=41978 RepID=UPI0025FD2E84|nr:LytTR family DNA-binding domain-containing protein [Ruminococcus sp.]